MTVVMSGFQPQRNWPKAAFPWQVDTPEDANIGQTPYGSYGSLATYDCLQDPDAPLCNETPGEGFFVDAANTCADQIGWSPSLNTYTDLSEMVAYLSALAPWVEAGGFSEECSRTVGYVVQHHPAGFWDFLADTLAPIQTGGSCSPTVEVQIPKKPTQAAPSSGGDAGTCQPEGGCLPGQVWDSKMCKCYFN